MIENKLLNLVKVNEKIRKKEHSRPSIMLVMMKMTKINFEVTERLGPNSKLRTKLQSERINLIFSLWKMSPLIITGLPHPGKVLESLGFFSLSWKVLDSP